MSQYEKPWGGNGDTSAPHPTNNSLSYDPYSLLNKLGQIDKSKLLDLNEFNQKELSLNELKMTTEAINQDIHKFTETFQNNHNDFDQSMKSLFLPTHRPSVYNPMLVHSRRGS